MFNAIKRLFGFGVRSRIHTTEALRNGDRSFGSALHYYPAIVVSKGVEHRALFTEDQLNVAIERAARNPEDWK